MSELLKVATVAAILKVSPDTVVRRFSKVKGVVNLGSEETRGKRRYRVIRIPKHVLERYVGHTISVPAPKPKSRKKSNDPLWIAEASQNLARAVNENAGDSARAVFETMKANEHIN